MAEKENKQRHKSTINKYFSRTGKAYRAWADENEEKRNFLQIAVELFGDTDEEGKRDCDLHICYSFKTNILAKVIALIMERDEDFRKLIIEVIDNYFPQDDIEK